MGILSSAIRGLFFRSNRTYSGQYHSWSDAQFASKGYDSDLILEKVRDALSKVKSGDAVYERDSVLFDRIQYSWPLLSGLLWVAIKNDDSLNLVDFGGSLGSSYYQNRFFLKHLNSIRWNILEQKTFVDCGKREFETDEVKFYLCLKDCLVENEPTVLLLSSVLQYLERPFMVLDDLLKWKFETVIVDRTPFLVSGDDRITIQKVPNEIYRASYPAWLFNETKFKDYFAKRYEMVAEFPSSIDLPHDDVYYKGFIFERKQN